VLLDNKEGICVHVSEIVSAVIWRPDYFKPSDSFGHKFPAEPGYVIFRMTGHSVLSSVRTDGSIVAKQLSSVRKDGKLCATRHYFPSGDFCSWC